MGFRSSVMPRYFSDWMICAAVCGNWHRCCLCGILSDDDGISHRDGNFWSHDPQQYLGEKVGAVSGNPYHWLYACAWDRQNVDWSQVLCNAEQIIWRDSFYSLNESWKMDEKDILVLFLPQSLLFGFQGGDYLSDASDGSGDRDCYCLYGGQFEARKYPYVPDFSLQQCTLREQYFSFEIQTTAIIVMVALKKTPLGQEAWILKWKSSCPGKRCLLITIDLLRESVMRVESVI